MPLNYWPVVVYILAALGVGALFLLFCRLVRPNRPDPSKLSPYECGCPPVGSARERFSVHFFIIAMLFVLFDLEAVFMYPWAIMYDALGLCGFLEMLVFIAILLVGYFYAWKKGALEWD
ncbi:MAG TPA: NADH-quinone oxidoreductase subunit A [Nitrospirota bacterium]